MLRRVWTSLALLVLCAQATPLAVTVDDRVVADAVVAALVAHGLDVVATDDARAPVVLAGHTRRTPVRSELLGPQLHRLDLTASLRLVRRLDGRVLATFELHGRGLGVSEVAAEQQAATEAVRALAEQVARVLAQEADRTEAAGSGPTAGGERVEEAAHATSGVASRTTAAERLRASSGPGAAPGAPSGVDAPSNAVRWRPMPGLLLTFEPAPVVDVRADPRSLRANLGTVRLARELAARPARAATHRVWLDARPLVASVLSATVGLGSGGAATEVSVGAALDLEVLAALRGRGPLPLRLWLDDAPGAAQATTVDVLPLAVELVPLWRANHRLLEGRTAEARALYRDGLAVVGSRVHAELLFGAALAARAGADGAAARALLADCLAEHGATCRTWVEALARWPVGAPPDVHLRWSP
jgi:hypothetical protein